MKKDRSVTKLLPSAYVVPRATILNLAGKVSKSKFTYLLKIGRLVFKKTSFNDCELAKYVVCSTRVE